MLDFASLERPAAPNTALYADRGDTRSQADAPALRFDAAPERVFAAWRRVAEAEPRTTVKHASGETLSHHAVQRSAVFRLPDDLYAMVRGTDGGGARVLLYSAARYGKSDFGVNRRRLERLSKALEEALGAESA